MTNKLKSSGATLPPALCLLRLLPPTSQKQLFHCFFSRYCLVSHCCENGDLKIDSRQRYQAVVYVWKLFCSCCYDEGLKEPFCFNRMCLAAYDPGCELTTRSKSLPRMQSLTWGTAYSYFPKGVQNPLYSTLNCLSSPVLKLVSSEVRIRRPTSHPFGPATMS